MRRSRTSACSLEVTSLPDHVLGIVFRQVTSPADRMSVLLACKRFLSVAVDHTPAWWESLTVSNKKGDRQDSFWLAHHQHVRSLHVANSAGNGRPRRFLELLQGLPGLPALETLKLEAPYNRFKESWEYWMRHSFQVINSLSALRHLRLEDQKRRFRLTDMSLMARLQRLPLLRAQGALSGLQSLVLDFKWCKVEVAPGSLRALGSLTRLHIRADLVRPPSSSGPGGPAGPFALGWADLEGTTALRQLHWNAQFGGRLSLRESEALSLLGRLEQLSVAPVESSSPGIWDALPQLAALTRVDLAFDRRGVWRETADPAPMRAALACANLKALSTIWLPRIQLTPGQLSSLRQLTLKYNDRSRVPALDGAWSAAMPALEAVRVSGRCLPAGMEALPSLKSLHFVMPRLDVTQVQQQAQQALDCISLLPHLTSLELDAFEEVAWPLPPGPYLSNLLSLTLRWTDAEAPIPPALVDAQCLTSLTLFPYQLLEQQHGDQAPKHASGWDAAAPPSAWAADDVALLRALPCLEKLELADFYAWAIYGKSLDQRRERAAEWQRSAEALGAQLPGVCVTARAYTRQEGQSRSSF